MENIRFVFPEVTRLTAGAVGEPGHRTFYILVGRGVTKVRVWVEKAQLQAVSAAIARLVVLMPSQTGGDLEEAIALPPASDEPLVADIQGGKLALGYDEERKRFLFLAHEKDAPEEASPMVGFWATLSQMRAWDRRIDEVCSAGRPICVLCGGPIDPAGHVCPRGNGHRPPDALHGTEAQ